MVIEHHHVILTGQAKALGQLIEREQGFVLLTEGAQAPLVHVSADLLEQSIGINRVV
ncbi:hypothetical protein D9M69_671740 [compost metagenome]